MENPLKDIISGKNVLFISPTDPEYIRNRQELDIIEKNALRTTIVTANKGRNDVAPLSIKKILATLKHLIPHIRKPFDTVFIGGMPQTILPFIYPFVRKKKIIVDFFISMYDTLVHDREVVRDEGLVSKLLFTLDTLTLSIADHVIVDTYAHASYFKEAFALAEGKTTVLYLSADERIYYSKNKAKLEKWKECFIVFFFGAMNPLQGVDTILQCAEILKNQNQIVFVLVGPIGKVRKTYIPILELPNVYHVKDWISQEEISDYIAMSDLCLAGHFASKNKKANRVIPGKAYIYLAMNKITVLGDNVANRELFDDSHKLIRFVPMGNAKALAKTILNVFNQTNETVTIRYYEKYSANSCCKSAR